MASLASILAAHAVFEGMQQTPIEGMAGCAPHVVLEQNEIISEDER